MPETALAVTLADLDAHPAIAAARGRWGQSQNDDPDAMVWMPGTYLREDLVAAGVSDADVDLFADRLTQAPLHPNLPTLAMEGRPSHLGLSLFWIAESFPDLTVTAAVRWLIVCEWLEEPAPIEIEPWVQAGLGEDGWAYLAAGLTPTEALAVAQPGSLPDADRVRALAALRGFVPLPT